MCDKYAVYLNGNSSFWNGRGYFYEMAAQYGWWSYVGRCGVFFGRNYLLKFHHERINLIICSCGIKRIPLPHRDHKRGVFKLLKRRSTNGNWPASHRDTTKQQYFVHDDRNQLLCSSDRYGFNVSVATKNFERGYVDKRNDFA